MSVTLNVQTPKDVVPVSYVDVVVVGAGPYGLSTAAHLLGKGLQTVVFGRPLSLWRENMPEGMFLRSYWWASNLSDPQKNYGFEQYFQIHGLRAPEPLPIEMFIDYALWFQKNCVPSIDETYITSIEQQGDRFEVTLEDGRIVRSRAVVMAPGLKYYEYRPAQYEHLSSDVVSHVALYGDFKHLIGKHVVVIGGGQSALENGAIMQEHGVDVTIVSRHPIHWLTDESVNNRSLYQRIRYPRAGIAPGWFNWGIENVPYAFQQLPRAAKDRLLRGRGRFGPAGSHWLKDRILGKVKVHENVSVQHVQETANGVTLKLSDNSVLYADHLVLATGYRADVWKLPMLHANLVSRLHTYQGAPVLNSRFETNIPGLYFVGFSSVSSFGPFYRFVVGTDAAASRLSNAVARKLAIAK